MASGYETKTNSEKKLTQRPEQLVPASSEAAYDRLTAYGFVQRYVKGKIVANIGWEEIGYGSRLLAESAKSVAGLASTPEAVDLASAVYSAPNASYQRVDLPKLPYSGGHLDVVVAFGVVENLKCPEDLVREAKRVLKKDGVLVISALDKQTHADDRDRGGIDGRRKMYVPEFRELLERHFGHVHIYRQGAVAGGFVFPASGEVTGSLVESARFSLTNPHPGVEPPTTRSVIAVCSDAEAPGQEEQLYLLLDRDRRIFDEREELAEDLELTRDEIQQMQETEVQAFKETIAWRRSVAAELNRYLIYRTTRLRRSVAAELAPHLIHLRRGIKRWLSSPYRWLRDRNRRSD